MRGTLWFDGQNVLEGDVEEIETSKSNELRRRLTDISLQMGIITGLTVTNPSGFQLRVAPGTAYDINGEVVITTVNTNITVSALDVSKTLVVEVSVVPSTPVPHPITGVNHNTRQNNTPVFSMVASPTSTQIPLAILTALDGSGNATLDTSVRVLWSPKIAPGTITDVMLDPLGAVITHIHTLGTGIVTSHNAHGLAPVDIGFTPDTTPTVHQQKDHESGIENGSTVGCLLPVINSAPAPDQLNVPQISGSDSALVSGNRITAITPTTLTFGTAPTNPALYEIYINSSGTLAASVRAQYTGAALVTGIFIVDISPGHPTGNFQLGQLGVNFLVTWDSGLDMNVDTTNDGFYIVRRPDHPEHWIKIWVDASALSTGQTNTVTVNASVGNENNLILCNLNWSGSGTGFLGFGNWAASGGIYDKRQFGNVGAGDVASSAVETYVQQYFRETRNDGLVIGGSVGNGGSLNATVKAGVAYVNGKRVVWDNVTKVVTNATDNYIWVDEKGVVQCTTFQPFTWGFTSTAHGTAFYNSSNVLARGAALAIVTASGGVITVVNGKQHYLTDHIDITSEKAYAQNYPPLRGVDEANLTFTLTGTVLTTGSSAYIMMPLAKPPKVNQQIQGVSIRLRGTGSGATLILCLLRCDGSGNAAIVSGASTTFSNCPNSWNTYTINFPTPERVASNLVSYYLSVSLAVTNMEFQTWSVFLLDDDTNNF